MRSAFWAGTLVAVALAHAGCGRTGAASDPEATENARVDRAKAPAAISIDPETASNIRVGSVSERDVSTTLTVAGKVQFDENRVARILAPLGGQIVGLRANVGERVAKGEPLCAIASREAAAAVAEHTESHKDLDLAQKTLAMTSDLFEHEAASKMALQQAQNDVAKAQSRVARADGELRVLGLGDEAAIAGFNGRLPVRSPIPGVVIERRVNEGQFVQPDSTPMITVANLSTVWVVGDVYERDLRFVSVGQSATIATVTYPDQQFAGRVDYVSDTIDPATRAAKLRISVPNPDYRLKPEMFATVSVGVARRERAFTVPSQAVFVEDGQTFVYAEVGRGRFVRKPVQIGPGEGGDRRVLRGLTSGDRIVVDGALLMRQEEEQRAGRW